MSEPTKTQTPPKTAPRRPRIGWRIKTGLHALLGHYRWPGSALNLCALLICLSPLVMHPFKVPYATESRPVARFNSDDHLVNPREGFVSYIT
jgi:hypothetical protein